MKNLKFSNFRINYYKFFYYHFCYRKLINYKEYRIFFFKSYMHLNFLFKDHNC